MIPAPASAATAVECYQRLCRGMPPRPVPPERQCHAMVRGQLDRGVYWVRPHRCLNYAGPNGYCCLHQPSAEPGDNPRTSDGEHASAPIQ